MKFLAHLRIGARLASGFGITLALLCLTGALAIYQVSRVYAGTEQIATTLLPDVQTLGDIRAAANGVRRATLRSLIEIDQTAKLVQHKSHDEALSKMSTLLGVYERLVSSPEEKAIYDHIREAWASILPTTAGCWSCRRAVKVKWLAHGRWLLGRARPLSLRPWNTLSRLSN